MIQVLTNNFKPLSQDSYNELAFSLRLEDIRCPCGGEGCLTWHGTYPRYVRHGGRMLHLRIRRVRCSKCGKTHAILPASLVPYSQIPLSDQQHIIYDATCGGDVTSAMEKNPLVDENNAKHILRQFRKYWAARLLFLGTSVMDALTPACFQAFSMQFMQIRDFPNTLFISPT